MPKNIVVCCDGTGNQFGDHNSNVIKLYETLDLSDPGRQVAYYHSGLGTMGAPSSLTPFTAWWTKVFGLAFGRGFMDDLGDAYEFLMETHAEADRVYIFGFSRGAYTARALAAMLYLYGLLRTGDRTLIRYVARLFRTPGKQRRELAHEFSETFSHRCPVHFVGVWDTVSSIRWWHPLRLPYTAHTPEIHVFRHAVSIDERRCYFWQNLWNEAETLPSQDVKQVWFAGVHSDVGGSYAEEQSGLSKVPLEWMLREACAEGLLVDQGKVDLILGKRGGKWVRPDCLAPQHESLEKWWWIPEYLPKRFWDKNLGRDRVIIPAARPRTISEGSLIHACVIDRMNKITYRPSNLPKAYTVVK